MADLATLAIKIENADVLKASSSLDQMARASATAEAAVRRDVEAFKSLGDTAGKTASQIRGALTSELAQRRKGFASELASTSDPAALAALQDQIVKTREMGQAAKACGLEIKRWATLEQQVAAAMNGAAPAIKSATSATTALGVETPKAEGATQRLTRRMALLEIEARKMDEELRRAPFLKMASDAQAAAAAQAKLEQRVRETDATLSRTTRTTNAIGSAIRQAFAFIGVGLLVRETVQLADSYTNLQARLRLVTTGTGNLAAVQAELFAQAQRTRTSFEATTDLYSRIARSAGQVGASQRDMLQVTETVNKAMTISGASAESAQAALIQFGQALSSNRLGGDELRSISEQAPRLAQAIAQGMGVSVGELKRLSQEGKLTADAVFKALIGQKDAIDREFAQMPKTIGGAMQQIKNEILQVFGESGGASAATGGIVTALDAIRSAIGPVARALNAFFGGFAIASADAALGLEKFRQKIAQIQLGIGVAIRATGNKTIGDALVGNATKALKDGDDIVRMLEKQRDVVIQNVHAYTELGAVSTTRGKPTPVVNPQDLKDIEAQQRAMDKYFNTLNQHRIDAINATATDKVHADQIRAMADAYREGQAAVEALTIAQAGDNAVRELGVGVTDKQIAARRRAAEEDARAAIELGHVRDEQSKADREAQRAADEAQRDMERRAKELHRTVSSTIEGILTDIDQHRNPFVAIFDNLKRGAIKAISDILASKIEGKIGDLLGIQMPATKQEKAGVLMNTAADKMLRAAADMNAGVPGDGLVGPESTSSATIARFNAAFKVAGAAYGGYTLGQGIGEATGDKVTGAIGGAVSGATAGAAIGGPVGAAVGGIAGFVGGILGAGDAARRAAEALAKAKKAFDDAFASAQAQVNHDQLSQDIAQVKAQFDQLEQLYLQANLKLVALGIISQQARDQYAAGMKEITDLEAKRIAQLEQEAAVMRRTEREDIEVQGIQAQADIAAAQGRTADADALRRRADDLAFQHEQQRQREAFLNSHVMDDSTIGRENQQTYAELLQTQQWQAQAHALQENTKALDALNTTVRNAPTGFKIEPYIQQFAAAQPRPGMAPINVLPQPSGPLTPPGLPSVPPGLMATLARDPMRDLAQQLDRIRPTSPSVASVSAAPTINFAPGSIVVQEAKDPKQTAQLIVDEIATKLARKLDEVRAAANGPSMTRAQALERLPSRSTSSLRA